MGRVRRQRRFKDIDPLSKRPKDEEDLDRRFNLEPHNEGNDAIPRKAQQIAKLSKVGMHGVYKKKKKAKGKLLQKPGESTRKFFDRLDAQVGEALNKALMETKQLRVKRKDHLKKRDQKQKRKKMKNFEQFEKSSNPGLEQTDHVKFGEVVSQPPTLSAVPRKGQAKKASLDLKLLKLVGKKNEDSIDKTYKLKRKEMTDKMKKNHDLEREKAIKEYRKMKQRKSIRT